MNVTGQLTRPRPGLLALSLLLAGCAVGPDYQPPQAQTPTSWRDLPSQAASRPQPGAPSASWWKSFNDPQLNSLIDRAIAATCRYNRRYCASPARASSWRRRAADYFPR